MAISNADLAKLAKYTLENFLKNPPEDQIRTDLPLLDKLRSRSKKLTGGLQNIVVQVRKSYDSNFGWTYGEAPITFNKRDPIDQARFAWKRWTDAYRIPYDELFDNGITVLEGGTHQFRLETSESNMLTNILAENNESLKLGADHNLALHLWRDGSSSADAPVGMDALVSTTPATGTVGSINRATAAWWRNNASTGIASTTAGELAKQMEAMWRACIRNGGKPDFIIAGSDFIDAYRQYAITVTNNADAGKQKDIDAGTNKVWFKGVEIVWDPLFSELDALDSPTIPWEKRCYMLNTKHIALHEGPIDVSNPTRPHDTYTMFTMATQRLAIAMKRANAHAVLSIA